MHAYSLIRPRIHLTDYPARPCTSHVADARANSHAFPPSSLVHLPSYASAYSPVYSHIQMLVALLLHLPNLLAHWLADRQAHLLGQSSVRVPMNLFANSCMHLDTSLLTHLFTCLFTCVFARLLICRLGHFPIHLPATYLPTLRL